MLAKSIEDPLPLPESIFVDGYDGKRVGDDNKYIGQWDDDDSNNQKFSSLESQNERAAKRRAVYRRNVLSLAHSYAKKARIWLHLHICLQIVSILGAVSLPILINTSLDKIVPTIMSLIIAIATGVSSWAKLGALSATASLVHRRFAREYQEFDLSVGVYKDLGEKEAFVLFVERTQAIRDDAQNAMASAPSYNNYQSTTPS